MIHNDKIEREVFLRRMTNISGARPAGEGESGRDPYLTRIEAATLVANILPPMNLGIAGGLMPSFRDIEALTPDQQQALRIVYNLGVMLGRGEDSFDPFQHLTQTEADLVLHRTQERLLGTKPAVPFELVADLETLPLEVRERAIAAQGTSGVQTVQTPDATYVILSAGERSTGGYQLHVPLVVQGAGQIELFVHLQRPAPGAATIQVITYPQVVLRLARTELPITVVNEQELY